MARRSSASLYRSWGTYSILTDRHVRECMAETSIDCPECSKLMALEKKARDRYYDSLRTKGKIR